MTLGDLQRGADEGDLQRKADEGDRPSSGVVPELPHAVDVRRVDRHHERCSAEPSGSAGPGQCEQPSAAEFRGTTGIGPEPPITQLGWNDGIEDLWAREVPDSGQSEHARHGCFGSFHSRCLSLGVTGV